MRKFDVACHVGYDPVEEVGTTPEELGRLLDRHEVERAVLLPMGEALIHRFAEALKVRRTQTRRVRSAKQFPIQHFTH